MKKSRRVRSRSWPYVLPMLCVASIFSPASEAQGNPAFLISGNAIPELHAEMQPRGSQSPLLQQSTVIRGRVVDSDGNHLDGVTVQAFDVPLPGSAQKRVATAQTDSEGRFMLGQNIIIVGQTYSLRFSSVGFETLVMDNHYVTTADTDGNTPHIEVILQPATAELEEVVVVGYGTQSQATVTGSVASVKGEVIAASPAANISNSLAGRISGLIAVSRSGEPGSDNSVLQIRGANTLGDNAPLVVVDGIPNRSLERLNPQDIESLTVLKDASAAIYGARAANGVILVTTKNGTTGRPEVRFSYNEARTAPTIVPRAADAATYAELLNEVLIYEGDEPMYSSADIQAYRDGSDPLRFPNTDWYKEALKPLAMQRNADISISGGQEHLRYYLSGGTLFQDGIYKNSGNYFKQHNLRFNLDGKLNDYVTYQLNVAGREVNRHYPTQSAGTIFNRLRASKPNMPAFWPTGEPADNGDSGNPVVITTNQTGYDQNQATTIESSASLDIRIPWVEGFSLTGNAAFDRVIQNNKYWATPWYLYAWDGQNLDPTGNPLLDRVQRGYTNAELTQDMSSTDLYTLNLLANYEARIAQDHQLKVLLGVESITGEAMNFSAFRRHFVSTAIDQMFAGGDAEKNNGGSASQHARLNYFGRVNYDYRAKYLLDFVWRYDGSYIFPANGRFGFFPGVSAGWRLSEESFWSDLRPVINEFKIRGSWGKTGNDRINPYQYLSSYGLATGAANVYVFNQGEENKILQELRIPNPNVTWEVANQSNVGIDMQLLNNRIHLSAEYFHNLRTDILWLRNASVPATSGLTLPRENIGEVLNRGFEFQAGIRGTRGHFTYQIAANAGFNNNKIQYWDETPGAPEYQQSTGYAMNTGLYYNAIGIFRDQAAVDAYPHWSGARPGDVIFEDVNGDGEINALDRVRINKTALPTHTGGLNLSLTYKGLFTNLFFQWATGAMRNTYFDQQGQIGNYLMANAEGRWTSENIDAQHPRIWNRYNEYWRNNSNTYWLENTDYLRLKNLEIGYNLPSSLTDKWKMANVQVYLTGLNLLTFTKVADFDPEANSATAYPLNKVYNFGIAVTF